MNKYNKISIGALAVIAACFMTMPAQAEEAVDVYKACAEVSDTAKRIMEFRQNGMPIVKIMNVMSSDMGRAMTIDAYSNKFWSYKKHKQESINKFANDYYLSCLKGFEAEL